MSGSRVRLLGRFGDGFEPTTLPKLGLLWVVGGEVAEIPVNVHLFGGRRPRSPKSGHSGGSNQGIAATDPHKWPLRSQRRCSRPM